MKSSSSSSSSSDDEYNSDFNIQWIFHFECFHYMKNVYIKEFTAFCIQTSDYFTCHVKCSPTVKIDADEIEKAVFERQSRRLGFKWEDGDYDPQEFHDLLNKCVPNIGSEIIVFDRTVFRYFDWNLCKPHTYSNVQMMENIPFLDIPVPGCEKQHCQSRCTERRVLQQVHAMQRALVPYYVPSVVYDYVKHIKHIKKLADRDSKSIKYGIHKFKTPLYRTLTPVNLYSNAGCELGVPWNAAGNTELNENLQVHTTFRCSRNQTSTDAAGAAVN